MMEKVDSEEKVNRRQRDYACGTLVEIEDPYRGGNLQGAVVHLTSPQDGDFFMPFMALYERGAAAIIYEHLGGNDHGMIAANEIGIPLLREIDREFLAEHLNRTVTVVNMKIVPGEIPLPPIEIDEDALRLPLRHQVALNAGFAEPLEQDPTLPDVVDGVAFARLEFLMAMLTKGMHPEVALERHDREPLVRALTGEMERIVRPFAERGKPVWMRTDDFSSNDLHRMEGGARREVLEPNPMLGWRGGLRSIEQPALIEWQLESVRALLRQGYRNIGLFPPMIRTIDQYDRWRRLCEDSLGEEHSSVAFGIMIEVPAIAMRASELRERIRYAIFGTNDLTQFTLAVDRTNPRLSTVFNEEDPGVLAILEHAITRLRSAGIPTFIGGQAASKESFVQKLCSYGLTGISLPPNRKTVAHMKRFLHGIQ